MVRVLEGNTVELRESPYTSSTKPTWKHVGGRGNDLGYGNNDEVWIIRSQAPKGSFESMVKVQRLSVGGLVNVKGSSHYLFTGIRYSPALLRSSLLRTD
jgi:hypothetical protein